MKKLIKYLIIHCVCCSIFLISPLSAYAFPIAATGAGLSVYVNSTADIIATYQGNSAAYSNNLYLENTNTFVFNNHGSAVGSTVNLGSFEVGTELVFRLEVTNTGHNFYTGPAARNPDNHTHARVESDWMGDNTLISFEDLFNGAFNYNDLSFSFSNTSGATTLEEFLETRTPVPEPSTFLLLGGGLAGLAFFARRRRKE